MKKKTYYRFVVMDEKGKPIPNATIKTVRDTYAREEKGLKFYAGNDVLHLLKIDGGGVTSHITCDSSGVSTVFVWEN